MVKLTRHIEKLARSIRKQILKDPRIGIVLGSGLGEIAESIDDPNLIPYAKLPGWPHSTVVEHSGRLVSGMLENQPVLVMQVRVHYFEGYTMDKVTLPIGVI